VTVLGVSTSPPYEDDVKMRGHAGEWRVNDMDAVAHDPGRRV
jgi:hypothetical protein